MSNNEQQMRKCSRARCKAVLIEAAYDQRMIASPSARSRDTLPSNVTPGVIWVSTSRGGSADTLQQQDLPVNGLAPVTRRSLAEAV